MRIDELSLDELLRERTEYKREIYKIERMIVRRRLELLKKAIQIGFGPGSKPMSYPQLAETLKISKPEAVAIIELAEETVPGMAKYNASKDLDLHSTADLPRPLGSIY